MKYSFLIIFFLLPVMLFGCRDKGKNEYNEEAVRETERALVGANRILVKKDQEKIKAYIGRHGLTLSETTSGLWYGIYRQGTGDRAEPGLLATLRYKVFLLDGTKCYDSDSLGVKQFRIGQGGVESGLEEGILMLREGDQARFIMPPHLAHGLPGDSNQIPARAIILYDVELLNVQP
ncbi:MAG TPA: FKBP-type peptidyl-prolyl cis-trans isomerase [Bacteroidales bacterium]|nr:FKBP-type peptidyl-prolyl cis-trans isomerase [Bacteroidales bacterium]